ncbi:peptidoglycan D,D-transpeptidase FtsI family protein [Homoserinibacter sp. YIM 151385]|uniref:peptidoglycan D,D-transpeptidase FtsI family protein n=1 Tax=Homoserinibacter sp. YIM 151385 TaxID=2985506 RepID=UPI0022F0E6E4|nr:penicillin-binding protein 2 [Homoserinibacter sp. YIM 151385]WBU38745.1 penicillin-binding protein 2 [Homoserinibacter sp. YIM 151385]
MSHARSTRRRLAASVIAVFAIVALFSVRLAELQFVRAEDLNEASDQKRVFSLVDYGIRGDIVDTNGVVLADSVERYNITASPKNIDAEGYDYFRDGEKVHVPLEQWLAELGEITGQKPQQIYDIIAAALAKDPESDFVYIKKNVKLGVLKAVRELKLPGIYDEYVPSRTYPNGQVAGNLVGFIGTDGPQAGLEIAQDDCLRSRNGTSTVELSADSVQLPGTEVVTRKARDGGDIRLTIDSNLEWYAQQALAEQGESLGAEWGTAMVVEVKTGKIRAAADWPTVDPNDPGGADRSALGARLFSSPYEPGSTVKAATIASYIDAGVITPTTKVTAVGRYTKGLPAGSYISDAWAHDDLHYTTAGVLMNSSNTGIAALTEKLPSKTARHDYLKAFGMGEPTGVDFYGESSGSLIPADQLDSITNITQQFGQGMTATSAQVAGIFQTLGNGGVKIPLSLVEGCENADGTTTQVPSGKGTRVVSEYAADSTVQMMETVVSTGFLGPILQVPGYRIGAKTGTAEVAENGRYGAERIVSVAGLVPAEDPEYAIVVTFAKPDTIKTSAAAAPTFNQIMKQVIKTFRITPSTKPAPDLQLEW